MRLPVRQPVTQYARLNPLAGAIAEIRRDVMSFTGPQSVKLTPSISLPGDFEIIWTGFIPNQTFGADAKTIFSSYEETAGAMAVDVRANRLRWFAYSSSGSLTQLGEPPATSLQLGKINTFSLRRQGTTAYLKANGVHQGSTNWDIVNNPLDITYINARGRGATPPDRKLASQNIGLEVYTGGDKNTGNLVLNLPLDNAASDNQINKVTGQVGAVMLNTLPGDWSKYERRDGWAFFRKVGAPSIKLEYAI